MKYVTTLQTARRGHSCLRTLTTTIRAIRGRTGSSAQACNVRFKSTAGISRAGVPAPHVRKPTQQQHVLNFLPSF